MSNKKIKRKIKRVDTSIFNEYWFEITIIFLLIFGLFLLIEDLEIKEILKEKGLILKSAIMNFLSSFFGFIIKWIKNMEVSDIVGVLSIMVAGLMLGWRFRQRFISNHEHIYDCPDCESSLQRIHATFWHKLIHTILRVKVKNYKCSKCSFKGYRISLLRK